MVFTDDGLSTFPLTPSIAIDMARNQNVAGASTGAGRKRKSTGDIEDAKTKPAKQPRKTLDAFFAPKVTTSSLSQDGEKTYEHVLLNEEQMGVLRIVVEGEKNVFFTGSAGARYLN